MNSRFQLLLDWDWESFPSTEGDSVLIASGVFPPSSSESVFRLILGFTCWCCTRDRKSLVYFFGFSIDTIIIHFCLSFLCPLSLYFLKSTIWSDIALQLQAFAYRQIMMLFTFQREWIPWFGILYCVLLIYLPFHIYTCM